MSRPKNIPFSSYTELFEQGLNNQEVAEALSVNFSTAYRMRTKYQKLKEQEALLAVPESSKEAAQQLLEQAPEPLLPYLSEEQLQKAIVSNEYNRIITIVELRKNLTAYQKDGNLEAALAVAKMIRHLGEPLRSLAYLKGLS